MITAAPGGGVMVEVKAQDPKVQHDPALCRRIVECVESHPRITQRNVEDRVEGKAELVRSALRWLREEGLIDMEKTSGGYQHTITDAGKDYLGTGTHTPTSTTR